MSGGLRPGEVPWWLGGLAVALGLAGVAFLHSASGHAGGGLAPQAVRQLVFLSVSVAAGAACLLLPLHRLRALAVPAFVLSLLLLAGLFVAGTRIHGALRWYRLGDFAFQPVEFAKVALVVVLARYLRFRSEARAGEGLGVPLLLAVLPAVLVVRQPDLGSAMIFPPLVLAVAYAAGAAGRQLLALAAAVPALALATFPLLQEYQQDRILTWWRQGSLSALELRTTAYQMHQSLVAVGSGGWAGHGFGQGPQNRFDFLPLRSEDYIFSVVAEETGFLGAGALLGAFFLLVLGLLRTAAGLRDRFARLLVVGVASWFAVQVWVHAAVCTSLLPATGLPLPFFSYGGSSLLACFTALGLAFNVAGRREPVLARDGFD